MNVKYYAWTTVGNFRSNNEDSLLCCNTIFSDVVEGGTENEASIEISEPVIFAVADGMGGAPGGEIASFETLSLLQQLLPSAVIKSENTRESIIQTIRVINDEVIKSGIEQDKSGMGSTLCGIVILPEKAYVFNVGDSRLFIKKRSGFFQITIDHSQYNITKNHCDRHILTSCIGITEKMRIDVFDISEGIESGDRIIISTDGLYDSLSNSDINESIDLKSDTEQIARKLIDFSLSKGSRDNISVITLKIC